MDRRILGGGAIVCSTMVLWSQSPATESGRDACNRESTNATSACSTENSTGQTPERSSPQNFIPEIRHIPELLSVSLQWSSTQSGSHSASKLTHLPDTMEGVYSDLLTQAQAAANQDQLMTALTAVSGIPKNSQHHERAQQLQENWSQELLQRATVRCQEGDVAVALSMLQAIPPHSQRYARATELRERWSQQAALLGRAAAAKNNRDWNSVIAALEALKGTPLYHSLPVQELLQQAIYHSFKPDEALVQQSVTAPNGLSINFVLPELSASANTTQTPASAQTSSSVESLPEAQSLSINLNQAMAWAQPPMPVASIPPPVPRQVARTSSSSPSMVFPVSTAQSIAPPTSIALLPFNKVRNSSSSRTDIPNSDVVK